jgi:hypothetical protein
LERLASLQDLPVPLEGKSAPTKGQLTRNFEQLQFERELAKQGEAGAPIRERMENQTATLIQNLDALADQPGGVQTELRDIGRNVDKAIVNRADRLKQREKILYKQAKDSGQMKDSVSIENIDSVFDQLDDMSDFTQNAKAIVRYAEKRGFISDSGGEIKPQPKTLEEMERFRQFVNASTDITDPRESRVRAIMLSAIDDATADKGGELYKRARNFSSSMRQELESAGLTKALLSSKRGTNARQIAYEDVFKKVLLDSPIEEVNKLRGTLLRSGEDGKQAWADIKTKGMEYIKESSQLANQVDSQGNPVFSPDKLNKIVKKMDDQGKLDSIYGKRNAQYIRGSTGWACWFWRYRDSGSCNVAFERG